MINIVLVLWHAVLNSELASERDNDVSRPSRGEGLRGKLNKVVLAYSGGLDTSVIVPWLRYYLSDLSVFSCLNFEDSQRNSIIDCYNNSCCYDDEDDDTRS